LNSTKILYLIISSIILTSTYSTEAFAQGLIDTKQIDQALKKFEIIHDDYSVNLTRNRSLRGRQKIIDSLLIDPFSRFNELAFLPTLFDANSPSDYEKYFGHILQYLDFEEYHPYYLETMVTASNIDQELQLRLDDVFGLDGAHVIRPYVSATLKAKILLQGDFYERKGTLSRKIYDNCDSVMLFLDDYQEEDPLVRYQAQQRLELQIEELSKMSPYCKGSDLYNIGLSMYTIALMQSKKNENKLFYFRDSIKTRIIETPHGRIAIGGKGNDRYEGDFVLILDVGGNDTYKLSDLSKDDAFNYPTRMIIDLSGDDIYNSGDYSLGGAVFGINIVIDRSGNDIYRAGEVALGAALYGFGILHDMDGDDKYMADRFACGAAVYGVGALIDNNGSDDYFTISMGHGFAGPSGFGALLEFDGNDRYISKYKNVALKYRNVHGTYNQGASKGFDGNSYGGIGLLADRSGNDNYSSKSRSQAYSENYSIAMLFDFNGNDKYESEEYSQAAASNYSLAYLLDLNGKDQYKANKRSLAYAELHGFALLYDNMGNESYTAKELAIAYGEDGGKSFLVDLSGNDEYKLDASVSNKNLHDFGSRIETCNYLLDMKGTDKVFGKTKVGKKAVNHLDLYLAPYDSKTPHVSFKLPIVSIKDFDDQISVDNTSLEKLLALVLMVDSLKNDSLQSKIGEAISQEGVIANDFISSNLNTNDKIVIEFLSKLAYSNIILETVLQIRINDTYIILSDSLNSDNFIVFKNSANVLGGIGDSVSIEILYNYSKEAEGERKNIALRNYARIGKKGKYPEIELMLDSEDPKDRATAVYTLFMLAEDVFPQGFISLPNDKSAMVRNAYYHAFINRMNYMVTYDAHFQNPRNKFNYSFNLLLDGYEKAYNERDKEIYFSMIPHTKPSEEVFEDFKDIFYDFPVERRRFIYETVFNSRSSLKEGWREFLIKNKRQEKNTELRELIK
jgi:hypothetical protein